LAFLIQDKKFETSSTAKTSPMLPTSKHKLILYLTTALAVVSWGLTTHSLNQRSLLNFNPNPAGIKKSPYGRTIALMVQAPVDRYWRAGRSADPLSINASLLKHNSLTSAWIIHLDNLNKASIHRTNRLPLSPIHKRYLYRKIQNSLKNAYHIDPTNHSNYALYHFFLTEAAFATQEISDNDVYALANQTLDYVKKETANPEPWLTGAIAAHHKMDFHVHSLRRQNKGIESINQELYSSWINEMQSCLKEFDKRRQRAINENRWSQIPSTRTVIMDNLFNSHNALLANHRQILKQSLILQN